ncbi:MAG: hypothetical protein WCK58_06050 [Chloroflexota bacterium]
MTAAPLPTDVRRLAPFPVRAVRPGGWIADQLRADLIDGFVGNLDRLAPDLVVDDDIYGRDRLNAQTPEKDLGAMFDKPSDAVQTAWWNSETQGNWREGWIHHCFWAGEIAHVDAARTWVERILGTQDADGYLGIHAPDLRYPSGGDTAELWGQTTLLRALLAYHGHTGEARVLEAVRRAVDRTMAGYPMDGGPGGGPGAHGAAAALRPFAITAELGGVLHGLVFTDVCWELAARTGDARYLAYAAWLYGELALTPGALADVQAAALLDPALGFRSHGVHTYEHRRALTVAAAAVRSGAAPARADLPFPALEAAYARKLAAARTPTGAPNGDEWCHTKGSADTTGYEHCSVVELVASFAMLAEATGDLAAGDDIESLVFNAGLGGRDPVEGGVAYLKTDNSRSMERVAGFRPPAPPPAAPQTRYMYSPLHREAALCCTPNAGRLLPFYARYQWLRADGPTGPGGGATTPEIVALLFGASVLATEVDGVAVELRQETAFPADGRVRFTVTAAAPLEFTLVLRRPRWAGSVRVDGVGAERVDEHGNAIRIAGPWAAGRTVFDVDLAMEPEVRRVRGGRTVVAVGPVLFALPLPGRREHFRTFEVPGLAPFHDVLVHPAGGPVDLVVPVGSLLQTAALPPDAEAARAPHAWQRRALAVRDQVLVPMAATTLRLTVFRAR